MEDLTKQQVVLLTLLVSIITSIATGIVTVSLMDQAPTGATHVINRVIEKTVEKVIPAQQGAAVITKETVVVKTEDQAVKVVENITPSLVKIFTNSKTDTSVKEKFVGIGLVVSKEGKIVTDNSVISATGIDYTVRTSSGTEHHVVSIQSEMESPIAVLIASSTPIVSSDNATTTRPVRNIVWKPVVFSDITSLRLGQSIIALSGEESLSVSLGNIRSLQEKENVVGIKQIVSIRVNADSYDMVTGGPLLDLFGEVLGLKMIGVDGKMNDYYVPASVIKDVLASPSKKP